MPERGRGWGRSCRQHLASPAALRRCLLIALVVGSVLTMINQGDLLLDGRLSTALAVKIPLNFVVPFVVSSIGYIAAQRAAGTAGTGTVPRRRPTPFR